MATASSSRSHGATTATTATRETVDSKISIAYGNRRTRHKLNKLYYGPGKRSFKYGVAAAICGFVILILGFTLLGLRFEGRLLVGSWEGEFIAPAVIIIGLLLFALAAFFFYRAYKKSCEERKNIRFKAEGFTHVATVNEAYQTELASNKERYDVRSGTASEKAVRSPNQSVYTMSKSGTLDSRGKSGTLDSRASRERYKGSLPSLDRFKQSGSLPSLDRQPQSPRKSNDLDNAPPKPMRSLDSLTMDLDDDRATPKGSPAAGEKMIAPRARSESEYSDVPLE